MRTLEAGPEKEARRKRKGARSELARTCCLYRAPCDRGRNLRRMSDLVQRIEAHLEEVRHQFEAIKPRHSLSPFKSTWPVSGLGDWIDKLDPVPIEDLLLEREPESGTLKP